MRGSSRSGSDFMICRECSEKFDLNASGRDNLLGGRFQPYCKRCAEKLGQKGLVVCVTCGDEVKMEDAQFAFHKHPSTGDVEPCVVCSQECTQRLIVEGQSTWREFGNRGREIDPPEDHETIEEQYMKEIEESEEPAYDVIEMKYVALSAARYISDNYRASVTVDTRLTPPESGRLPLVISPRYGQADDEYIEQFNRISIPTPVGNATLRLDGEEAHEAFGVCKFQYDLVEGK